MGTFRKASRANAKLRVALLGGHDSGKTLSALRMARGLVGPEASIGIVETEAAGDQATRSEFYADRYDFATSPIAPPFRPETGIQRIEEAGRAGIAALIIDSLSDFWVGVGGLLADAKGSKQRSFFNGDGKERQTRLMDAIARYPGHVFATIRLGERYVVEDGERGGAPSSRRVTLSPAQSADFGYWFNAIFEIGEDHRARMVNGKVPIFRIGQAFQIGEEHGQQLAAWLAGGASEYVPRGDVGTALMSLQHVGLSEAEAKAALPGFPDHVTPQALQAARDLYAQRNKARKQANG